MNYATRPKTGTGDKIKINKVINTQEDYSVILRIASQISLRPTYVSTKHCTKKIISENIQVFILENCEAIRKFAFLIALLQSFSPKFEHKLKASSFTYLTQVPDELHSIMGQFTDIQTMLQARLVCQATNKAFLKALEIEKSDRILSLLNKSS